MTTNNQLPESVQNKLVDLVTNLSLTRSQIWQKILDAPNRDLNKDCGYPAVITPEMYEEMYNREGLGSRVVEIFPQESWLEDPFVYETEDETETDFETTWNSLQEKFQIYTHMQTLDEQSGIGHYGVLLFGLNDGKPLDEPVDSVTDDEEPTNPGNLELLYLRAFPERQAVIQAYETDQTSPRFGLPTMYSIEFTDIRDSSVTSGGAGAPPSMTHNVHWTRVLHFADNTKTSPVLGTPRQQKCFNRLLDLRKMLGASAEMYWKGGFPGISFELNPELATAAKAGDIQLDTTAVQEQVERYMNNLQRYIASVGLEAKSLTVQIADPTPTFMILVKAIAITVGCPYRVLMGTEEAKLAGDKDDKNWNKRIMRRNNRKLTPFMIRPICKRLMSYGVLPVIEEVLVDWPDLNTPDDATKADIAQKRADALSKYVTGQVEYLMSPFFFLTTILGLDEDVARAIEEETKKLVETDDVMTLPDEEEKAAEEDMRMAEMEVMKTKAIPPPPPAAKK